MWEQEKANVEKEVLEGDYGEDTGMALTLF